MGLKKFYLIFLFIFLSTGIISAGYGYNNPTLPKLESEVVSGTITNINEINTSLNGSYWSTSTSQSSLSGTKTGTYILSTTGTGTFKGLNVNTVVSSSEQVGLLLNNNYGVGSYDNLVSIKAITYGGYGMSKITFGRYSDYAASDQDSNLRFYTNYQGDEPLMLDINGADGFDFQYWNLYTTGTISTTAKITGGNLQATSLTTGRVALVTTSGNLVTDIDLRFVTDTLSVTKLNMSGNIWFNGTNQGIYFNKNKNASIVYDSNNLVFNISNNGTGSLFWFNSNLSALSYITRTTIYDKTKGSALDKIKDSDEYIDRNGKINHSEFYGNVEYKVTDYSRSVIKNITYIECEWIENKTDVNKGIIEVCDNRTRVDIIYPYTKIETGVDLGKEIDVLRQGIYELKSELCLYKTYTWCN